MNIAVSQRVRQFVSYKTVQNLVLDCSLPTGLDIGFSGSSRQKFEKESENKQLTSQFDFLSKQNAQTLYDWRHWKSKKIALYIERIATQIKKEFPYIKIALRIQGGLLDEVWNTQLKNFYIPDLLLGNFLDEIIVCSVGSDLDTKRDLRILHDALQDKGIKPRVSVALDLRRNGKALDPLTQLLNLQGESFDGIVVKVEQDADLPRAQAFVKDTLPDFEFGLR